MPQTSNAKRFFISYMNEDREVVQKINQQLKKLGYETFFDNDSIVGGDDWRQRIKNAIKEWCDYFLVIWSAKGGERTESFVPVELEMASEKHLKRRTSNGRFIIPVLIGSTAKFPQSFDLEKLQFFLLEDGWTDSNISELVLKISDTVESSDKGLHIDVTAEGKLGKVLDRISREYPAVIDRARISVPPLPAPFDEFDYIAAICNRNCHIGDSVERTIRENTEEVEDSIGYLKEWMINETVVRVIGAGRAKLAAVIPANRLAHGGARVYVQDGIVPMPHDIKGGGIVAASASGETPSVLGVLREIHKKSCASSFTRSPFKVIGIARKDAAEFKSLCDVFIGILLSDRPNPLRALADTEEFVISLVLDALVVAAGLRAGFDNTKWRLGHENLGATGPYDAITSPLLPPHAPHKLNLPP
jgi:D-arabinose 5-phosphate isomerase GutQ